MKINIDSIVLSKMGWSQNGAAPYQGYSLQEVVYLTASIKEWSTKNRVDKDLMLEKIETAVSGYDRSLPFYGLGYGDFLIGLAAEKKHKSDG